MATAAPTRKPLGVRATPEQHRILTEAAAREHRSVSSFVLSAALNAATSPSKAETSSPQLARPRRSREEMLAIFRDAREAVRAANPDNRDILAEFLAERRAEAERE